MNKNLAFWQQADDIVDLARNGLGIIVMPTGVGKTTQTPQALHQAGFTKDGLILISVPKRVLAVELAARVAEEMAVPLGGLVGYTIRGENQLSQRTRIIFMTEGMLRHRLLTNPTLNGVSVVILDEFHNRSLLSDFNAALIERARSQGSRTAMLLMSATIDPSKLTQHFNCGLVDGSNLIRNFVVNRKYSLNQVHQYDMAKVSAEAASWLLSEQSGNGLIFMPGKGEIEDTIQALLKLGLPANVRLLPMHGDLPAAERHAPFAEYPGRTVTVATDIVETGATLPGIGWVIDSGLARERSYDPSSDIGSLKLGTIAKDRISQRQGRAGRVQEGVYQAMFTLGDWQSRPEHTRPEIERVPLREVVLSIKSLGLSREHSPLRFIDDPGKEAWRRAKHQLQAMGFVERNETANITAQGRQAAKLSCDPREAAMLLKAAEFGALREVALAATALQGKRLLLTPKGKEAEAYEAHRQFNGQGLSDSWPVILVVRAATGRIGESLAAWCRHNFISYSALTDLLQGSRQLLDTMRDFGYPTSFEPASEAALARAIAAGLPDRRFQQTGEYGTYQPLLANGSPDPQANPIQLGRESKIKAKLIAAWEIIEISTRRGPLLLITNAVALPDSPLPTNQ